MQSNAGKAQGAKKPKGEIYEINGVRYKRGGKKSRRVCTGDNNTCKKRATNGVLCDGHISGRLRQVTNDYVKGQIVDWNGERRKFNGEQLVKMCEHIHLDGSLCESKVQINGKCKTHAPEWKCKFVGFECPRIRIYGDYCTLHRDGIQHKRIKSKGEEHVAKLLDAKGIAYDHNRYIRVNANKYIFLDFYLPAFDSVIEVDGDQHEKEVPYWGGKDGLARRKESDRIKNEWCDQQKKPLLRIRTDSLDTADYRITIFTNRKVTIPDVGDLDIFAELKLN